MLEYSYFNWDWFNNSWHGYQKFQYTYNSSGNQLTEHYYHWLSDTTWSLRSERKFYYRDVVSLREHALRKVSLYPNPANGYVKIRFVDKDQIPVLLEIYDVNGRRVVSQEVRDNMKLPIDQLPTGVYSYVISDLAEPIWGKLMVR